MIEGYEELGGHKRIVYVWIDEPLPVDFDRLLLLELLMLAEPVGLGAFEALARKSERLDAILDEALVQAAHNHRGKRNIDDAIRFDYVSGYRIKVEYLPFGLSIDEDSPDVHYRNQGMPVVLSAEFDRMYGDGALKAAVGLAFKGS